MADETLSTCPTCAALVLKDNLAAHKFWHVFSETTYGEAE